MNSNSSSSNTDKQHILTNGHVEFIFEHNRGPRFCVYNHRPQQDVPIWMNYVQMRRFIECLPAWQKNLVVVQEILDAVGSSEEALASHLPEPQIVNTFGRNAIMLLIQTFKEKAYLWLKLHYMKPDGTWHPARGGIMLSANDDATKLQTFMDSCFQH